MREEKSYPTTIFIATPRQNLFHFKSLQVGAFQPDVTVLQLSYRACEELKY